MNINSFMNLLTIFLVAVGVTAIGWKPLRNYFSEIPKISSRPLDFKENLKNSFLILKELKLLGLILTGSLVISFLIMGVGFGYLMEIPFFEPDLNLYERFSVTPVQFCLNFLSRSHSAFFQTWSNIFLAKTAGGYPLFVLFLIFYFNNMKKEDEPELNERISKIRKYLLFSLIPSILLIIVAVFSVNFILENYSLWKKISYPINLISKAFLQFPESIVEWFIIGTILTKNRTKLFNENISSLILKIFLFNIFIFLPGHLFKNNIYLNFVSWFIFTSTFLMPFILVKENASLLTAFKRNVQVVISMPKNFFVLISTICFSAMFIVFTMEFFSTFALKPLAMMANINYIYWNRGSNVIINIIYLWFSLFSFCFAAVFLRESLSHIQKGQVGDSHG